MVEDYLKRTNDIWFIIKNKACIRPASKFDTIKYFPTEEALEEWDTTEATVTQKLVLEPVLSEKPDDEEIESEDEEESKSGTDQELEEVSV